MGFDAAISDTPVRRGPGRIDHEQRTDWRRRPLTEAQISYALEDVRYLIPLYERLNELLDERGRRPWFDEEMATWRADIAAHAKATNSAALAIKAATGLAEASLTQPGQPALDPKTFDGETITKDVVVDAELRTPDGQTTNKQLTITIARVASLTAAKMRSASKPKSSALKRC